MPTKRIKVIKTLQILTILSLVSLAIVFLFLEVLVYYHDYSLRADTMREKYLAHRKEIIKREIDRAVDTIQYHRSLSEQRAKDIVRGNVYKAYAIAENIYKQNREKYSEEEVQQFIIDALREARFNEGKGYYFITRLDGVEILFADRPDMEGLNLLEIKDSEGKPVINDMIEIAQTQQEGYYDYLWSKPRSPGMDHLKISFIKLFEPYRWIIGTGVYFDDVEQRIKEDMISYLSQVRIEDDPESYIFIVNWSGESLAGPGKGKNMIDATDADGMKVVRELIALSKAGGGFLEYRMPSVSKDVNRPKISYVRGIEEWQWYVGTGVYTDYIEEDIALLRDELKGELWQKAKFTLIASAIVILAFLLVFQLIIRRLKSDFTHFISSFNRSTQSEMEEDCSRVRFEEFFQITDNANRIMREKLQARENLIKEKERLAVTLRSIDDGVLTTDATGNVQLINRAAEKLTGICEAEAMGTPLPEVFRIECEHDITDSTDLMQYLQESSSESEQDNVAKLTSLTGETFHVEYSVVALMDNDGVTTGYVIAFRDITDRLKNEEESLKLKKLESMGVLAGGIAHDFNNLLTGIYGNIELAKMLLEEDHRSYRFLESSMQSIDSAANLTKQLLTFAKGGDPIKTTLSLKEIVTETAQFSVRGSNVALNCEIEDNLWLVEADKGQISQVISNLVINAQQAMPTGGTITISARNLHTEAGKRVQITIRDEGVGIAPQHLDRIFDPYFSTKQHGSGLGLASTYSIIKKHHGKISVESELNRGTTFTIQLPATDSVEPDDSSSDKQQDQHPNTQAAILLLDDEAVILDVAQAMLSKMGHEVDCTKDGIETIEKYRQRHEAGSPYDIVIMDLTIPGGMGGQEAALGILSVDPDATLIVSSGYATSPVMANFEQHGFKAVVAKPYNYKELEDVIRRVLAK